MSWLDNLKIVVKVGLIVALLGIVMIGETLFAASRMRAMDDANTDIVTRVDKYTDAGNPRQPLCRSLHFRCVPVGG